MSFLRRLRNLGANAFEIHFDGTHRSSVNRISCRSHGALLAVSWKTPRLNRAATTFLARLQHADRARD